MSQLASTKSIALLFVSGIISVALAMNKMPPPEVKSYPGFGRSCSTDDDCTFNPQSSLGGGGPIFLKCKPASSGNGNFCTCGSGAIPEKELMWPLEWDSMTEKCFVGKSALCGDDKGLEINCKSPFECLQNRCRISSEIHSVTENNFCQDDMDCKEGLKCQESRLLTVVKTQRCYRK
jgi:hypothetical protein